MPISATQNDMQILNQESPLAQAEAAKYVEQQKSADLNRNISQYMFWGATSIIGAIAVGLATSGVGPLLLIGGGLASAATFVGSVVFSRKATEISERSNVLYSDIDSQNQARRMVQTFARAQAQDSSVSQDETPFTSEGPKGNWAARTGGPQAAQASSWQSRIAAQADREDAQALSALRA